MISLFQWSTSPVAIFHHHQRVEFTLNNSHVILELVFGTVIFCTEISCWRKSYSNKAALFLGWSHPYKTSVVITIWLTVTKYLYLKSQWIFYILRRCFYLYHCQDFHRTWLYIWVTRRVSYKKDELITRREHLDSTQVFGRFHIAHIFSLLCRVLF